MKIQTVSDYSTARNELGWVTTHGQESGKLEGYDLRLIRFPAGHSLHAVVADYDELVLVYSDGITEGVSRWLGADEIPTDAELIAEYEALLDGATLPRDLGYVAL